VGNKKFESNYYRRKKGEGQNEKDLSLKRLKVREIPRRVSRGKKIRGKREGGGDSWNSEKGNYFQN